MYLCSKERGDWGSDMVMSLGRKVGCAFLRRELFGHSQINFDEAVEAGWVSHGSALLLLAISQPGYLHKRPGNSCPCGNLHMEDGVLRRSSIM